MGEIFLILFPLSSFLYFLQIEFGRIFHFGVVPDTEFGALQKTRL